MFHNALYKKLSEAYTHLNSEWSKGAFLWCETAKPELIKQMHTLEDQINNNMKHLQDRKTYHNTLKLITGWTAIIKEIIFHHKDHLRGENRKKGIAPLPPARSSNTGESSPLPVDPEKALGQT